MYLNTKLIYCEICPKTNDNLCNIFVVFVPAIHFLGCNNTINSLPDQSIWITTRTFRLTKHVVMIRSEPCLDCQKSLLNGIQVWRVGRQVQQLHSTIYTSVYSEEEINDYIPCFNPLMDPWDLMDACIVHDKHWVWQRPRLHLVQNAIYKILEFFTWKWMV